MTKQRKLIYDIVTNSKIHPTAEQVFFEAKAKMPKVVLATVYNNLNALTDSGEIRRISIHGEPDRYDNTMIAHEHIKCDVCGTVSDVILGDLFTELSKKTGVELTSYELNMRYICDECRINNKN